MCARVCATLLLVFGALFACSVTSTPTSQKDFSGDVPTGLSCPSSCNTCAQNSCGSTSSCLGSQCVDFLDCFCSCAAGDSQCQFVCISQQTPDNHCADCVTAAKPCLAQKCASECPDFNPPLSSGTFDAGGGSSEGGGSGPFPVVGPLCPAACGQCIESNCPAAATCYATDCSAFYTCVCPCSPADIACLRSCTPSAACQTCAASASACVQQHCVMCSGAGDAGITLGLGADGGDFCSQLSACCPLLTDSLNRLSCTNTVSAASELDCESALNSYRGSGQCP